MFHKRRGRVSAHGQRGNQRTLSILLGVFAMVAAYSAARAQATPHIEWEVYNRFRFYKNPQIFRDYLNVARRTAAAGAAEWTLNTENALQTQADNEKAGWAANTVGPQDLCWNRGTLRYDGCGSEAGYILPKTITILARLANAPTFETATCLWTLAAPQGGSTTSGGPCAGAKIDIPFTADGAAAPQLSVVIQPGGAGARPDDCPRDDRHSRLSHRRDGRFIRRGSRQSRYSRADRRAADEMRSPTSPSGGSPPIIIRRTIRAGSTFPFARASARRGAERAKRNGSTSAASVRSTVRNFAQLCILPPRCSTIR